MSSELSTKDQKIKEYLEQGLAGDTLFMESKLRRYMRLLPSDPRCKTCLAPFEGVGGSIVKLVMHKEPSDSNPLVCNTCEDLVKRLRYGTEVEMSMLFADIRGSTPMAEQMSPTEFKQIINRFYGSATHVLMHSYAMLDKLIGDEVSAFYIPSIAGKDYARKSIDAAQKLLEVTGHRDPDGPWVPVGVGIHTGKAYYGAVGMEDGPVDITALGDAVNVASRLASQAGVGEVIISHETAQKAQINTSQLEERRLDLKGKSEPMNVWVIDVKPK